jgi:hypothetical protein
LEPVCLEHTTEAEVEQAQIELQHGQSILPEESHGYPAMLFDKPLSQGKIHNEKYVNS